MWVEREPVWVGPEQGWEPLGQVLVELLLELEWEPREKGSGGLEQEWEPSERNHM